MPSNESQNNLFYGWQKGENYAAQMDSNLLKIGTLLGLRVIDRDLTTPPSSPTDGDCYIVNSTASGSWSGHEDKIAIFRNNINSWEFYDPSLSGGAPTAFIVAESRLAIWNGSDWSLGINLS